VGREGWPPVQPAQDEHEHAHIRLLCLREAGASSGDDEHRLLCGAHHLKDDGTFFIGGLDVLDELDPLALRQEGCDLHLRAQGETEVSFVIEQI